MQLWHKCIRFQAQVTPFEGTAGCRQVTTAIASIANSCQEGDAPNLARPQYPASPAH